MQVPSLVLWNVLSSILGPQQDIKKPNIVFIIGDDIGWNDVGWANSKILSPNLDSLAHEGVILNSSYTQPVCTPSRASILTGMYPHKLGLQHGSIKAQRPHGLPLNVTLLPQRLRDLGYATHLIGKWHLGFCKWPYTPTYRGFDSFYGFYNGGGDYYRHRNNRERGYDLRVNKKIVPHEESNKRYSTHLFASRAVSIISNHKGPGPFFLMLSFQAAHIPLQVPIKYERMYNTTRNTRRRKFSGMITAMDEAVGRVVSTLLQYGKLDDTIIIFTSDNGASPRNGGSNWPLRGGKATLWEGGTRVPTFIWSKHLQKKGYVHNGLFHATDWYPTLLSVAGQSSIEYSGKQKLNGIDQWPMLGSGEPSKRKEFVYAIDEITNSAALRMGRYKYIQGNAGTYRDWFPPIIHSNFEDIIHRVPNKNVTLLFDLERDPFEMIDISDFHPEIVKEMKSRLDNYKAKLVPSFYPRKVWKSHPKFWNGVWSPGWCN